MRFERVIDSYYKFIDHLTILIHRSLDCKTIEGGYRKKEFDVKTKQKNQSWIRTELFIEEYI